MVKGATERHDMVTGVQRESLCGNDMMTAGTKQSRNCHDMVTEVQKESPCGHHMVTGVHEEFTYCPPPHPSTFPGKQKKNHSTNQLQFRSENTPATIEADQILLAFSSWQITTILRTFIIT